MGLSSSSSKTSTTQNQNTNQTETGTTTPITPDWLTNAASDYVNRIGSFGNQDPNSFVAGAAPLQQAAWNNASSLGDWRQQASTAAGMAQQAGQSAPNLAGRPGGAMGQYGTGLGPAPQMSMAGAAQMQGMTPPQMQAGASPGADNGLIALKSAGPAHSSNLAPPSNAFSGASAQQAMGLQMAPSENVGPPNYQPPSQQQAPQPFVPSGLVSGAGYQMPQGQSGYAQPRTGYPIGQGPAYGYDPSTVATPTIAQTPGATATNATSASVLDNLGAYQNPYTTQVRNAALNDFDQQSAVQQAGLEAQGARNGAFGGSRFGIAQGQMLGDQDRARASLDAGLLDQGFNTAAQLSQGDAANRQQTSMFNAQNDTGVSQFNSAQDAARAAGQAGLGMQAGLANQSAYDAAGQYNSGANNNMSQFNAQQQDASLNRQLQAAGMIGGLANDYGTGTRADLGTMATLGDQQRGIEQAYDMSGPAQLQLMGQLSGMTPYDILVGRQVNGNTTGQMSGTGTSTVTQSPSLFSQLLGGAAMIPGSVFK